VPSRYIVRNTTRVPRASEPDFRQLALPEVTVLELDDDEARGVRVVGARQAGESFAGARFSDMVFERCDLSGCDFTEARFDRVRFVDCRATAVELGLTVLRDVVVADSRFAEANLRFAKLTGVRFEATELTAAELIGAELDDVSFEGCDLRRADLSQGRWRAVDLRGASLDELRGAAALAVPLSGATIAPDQLYALAPILALAIGVVVRAPDDQDVRSEPESSDHGSSQGGG
jgi:uncharacterized protein YjbI with pentapeptide repeats